MFCPSCGNNNLENAQFCRSCGANISLVPQALTGQLPTANSNPPAVVAPTDKHGREMSRGHAVQMIVMAFGFAGVAAALAISGIGRGWWFWFLIPFFTILARGIGAYMQVEEHEKRALAAASNAPRAMPPHQTPTPLPGRDTGPIAQPFSVTEAPTRTFDSYPPREN
jgi:hypothetical protein